jgi:hypothetical protein
MLGLQQQKLYVSRPGVGLGELVSCRLCGALTGRQVWTANGQTENRACSISLNRRSR